MDNKRWDIYETAKGLYEDVIQKGETFSFDMGLEIQKEIDKMKKQKEEWLKNNGKGETDTTDISDSQGD